MSCICFFLLPEDILITFDGKIISKIIKFALISYFPSHRKKIDTNQDVTNQSEDDHVLRKKQCEIADTE